MDCTYPEIDNTQFPIFDWSEFYGEVEEPILRNAPKAIGKVVDLRMFVNCYNAGDRRSMYTKVLQGIPDIS